MAHAKPKHIVVLGAGFGGIYAFKRLHAHYHKDPSVRLVLVNRENYFLFTPLLHEVATGSIFAENIVEPIRKVVGCCLADFLTTEVEQVSLKKNEVQTKKGVIPYDQLVIALGAETNFFNTPGAEEHCYTLKTLKDALHLKNRFIGIFEKAMVETNPARRKQMLQFVVIGGGPTGVELAAEMAELFFDTFQKYFDCGHLMEDVRVVLVQRDTMLLPQFSTKMRKRSADILEQKGVDVRLGVGVVEVKRDAVLLDSGERLRTDTAIWVAGVKPSELAFDQEPERDRGRLVVDASFRLQGTKNVFVLGDMAAQTDARTQQLLPQLAQVATAQGAILADNVRLNLLGKPLKLFAYKHKGSLVSVGQWMAIAEFATFHIAGHITWWIWRTIYLTKLISWQKKFQVAVDWTINLFSPRDISKFGEGELTRK